MRIITIIEDLFRFISQFIYDVCMVNNDYHLERSYSKSSTNLRLILHDCRMIVHESSYNCTWLDAVILRKIAVNADLCHGFRWFTIKGMFSYIRTMPVWLSVRLCYEQWYDYSWSIVQLRWISDDSEQIDADLLCDMYIVTILV